MSCQQIAYKNGVSSERISNVLTEAGIEIRGTTPKKELPMGELIADYQSGVSMRDLTRKYDADPKTIRTRLKEAEVYMPRILKGDLSATEIIADYQSGISINRLANRHNASYATIRSILVEAGIEIRGRKPKKELPMDEIIADYQLGISVPKIAGKYDTDHKTIRTRLKEVGVYQPRRRTLPKGEL
jgi:hypothetical protein